VTGFTLEGLLGRRGKLRSVGESENHSARKKMLQDELYLLFRHPLKSLQILDIAHFFIKTKLR